MNPVVYQLVSFLIKRTWDAFCNLCYHFYQYIHLLVLDHESIQIFLSLCQNSLCINTNCLRFVVSLVCGKHNASIINKNIFFSTQGKAAYHVSFHTLLVESLKLLFMIQADL